LDKFSPTTYFSFEFQIERIGPNAGYFTEEIVLNRVPGLLLLLAGVYLVLGLFGSLMICQPPEDWIRRKSVSKYDESDSIEMNTDNEKPMLEIKSEDEPYIHWKDALKMKEFYILWITRLSVVLITQVCKIFFLRKNIKNPCNMLS
jgi:hypothetical protein